MIAENGSCQSRARTPSPGVWTSSGAVSPTGRGLSSLGLSWM